MSTQSPSSPLENSSSTPHAHPLETNSGIVTSWLAVASAWPAVPQCSTEIYSQVGNAVGLAAIAFDPLFGVSISTQVTCLPPVATSWWNQRAQTPLQTVTSIGPLVCPQLYTTATTSALNSVSTFVACCPSDYTFQRTFDPGTLGQCVSPLPVGRNFTYMSGDTVHEAWVSATTLITASGGSVYGIPMNGYVFASASLAATTTTATPAPVTSSSRINVSTSVATNVPAGTPNPSRLSLGAKAGIGVGVTLAILGLCTFVTAWVLIRRHRRRHLDTAYLTNSYDQTSFFHRKPGEDGSVYEMGVPPKALKEML